MNKPRVYVNCCTYNQVNYIRDALEGFVMQKTNFPFEVHVNDDASTDGTQEIIKEYAQKYPDIIKPLLRTVNTNAQENYSDSWKAVDCEYFANCEGDDYWTDPNKLQMQVDFLDSHPDFAGCFHQHKTVFSDGSHEDIVKCPEIPGNPDVITLKDLLEQENFISNASIMYRWRFNRTDDKIEDWWPKRNIDPGDWFMHLSHLQKGNFGFIKKEMSVWRVQKNGIWFGRLLCDPFSTNRFWLHRGETFLAFLDECQERFGMEIDNKRAEIIHNIVLASIYFGKYDVIERLIRNRGSYYDWSNRPYDQEDLSSIEEGLTYQILNNPKLIKKVLKGGSIVYRILSIITFGKKCKKNKKKYNLLKNMLKKI